MRFETAVETVRSYGVQMLSDPQNQLTAIAVGRKSRGPIHAGGDDFAVTGFVERKLSQREIADGAVVSFDQVVRQSAGQEVAARETDVDVVETGSAFAPHVGLNVPFLQRGRYGGSLPAVNAQKGFRTLRAGIGVTNPEGSYPGGLSVGTAGFYLRDDDGEVYMVSNNHVIGRSNDAAPGEPVVQPGTLDLTGVELDLMPALSDLVSQLEVARVTAVVPLRFIDPAGTPNNRTDAGLARLTNSGRDHGDLDRLTYGGAIRGVAAPYEIDANGALAGSDRVYKVGRTSGYTEGQVTHLAGASTINYDGGQAHFVDQIVIEQTRDNVGPFSAPGDSGSGVLNDRHELVGLLFAGSRDHTLINPIATVLDDLRTAAGIASLQVVTG